MDSIDQRIESTFPTASPKYKAELRAFHEEFNRYVDAHPALLADPAYAGKVVMFTDGKVVATYDDEMVAAFDRVRVVGPNKACVITRVEPRVVRKT
jgi:hypothetical protein